MILRLNLLAGLLIPALLCSTAKADDLDDVFLGADKIAKAMVAGDWEVPIQATDAKAIKMLGFDPEELAQAAEMAKQMMEANGVAIVGCKITRPEEIHRLDSYDIVMVPITTEMTVQDRKVSSKGFLVAVKYAGEKEWKYVDAAQMTRGDILKVYPELPKDVKLPETEMIVDGVKQ